MNEMDENLEAKCPRCGDSLRLDCRDEILSRGDTVVFYSDCTCGACNITVKGGKILGIELCTPWDVLAEEHDYHRSAQAEEEYMAWYYAAMNGEV